jgi:hypothetical protein
LLRSLLIAFLNAWKSVEEFSSPSIASAQRRDHDEPDRHSRSGNISHTVVLTMPANTQGQLASSQIEIAKRRAAGREFGVLVVERIDLAGQLVRAFKRQIQHGASCRLPAEPRAAMRDVQRSVH